MRLYSKLDQKEHSGRSKRAQHGNYAESGYEAASEGNTRQSPEDYHWCMMYEDQD